MKPKPWSVADFERFRIHLTLFVKSEVIPLIEDDLCRRILLDAPVKCGKKDIVEYIAMRDSVHSPTREHVFVSAWHRTADEEQREELKQHNMTVFSITSPANVAKFNKWLEEKLAEGKAIVVHLDECDHGSGSKQTLHKIWTNIRDCKNITTILYSATPEEVLFTEVDSDEEYEVAKKEMMEGEHVTYIPPEGYCGAERFLREGLVQEAVPFFVKGERYTLSSQGKEIIQNMVRDMETDPSRNILILRLSGSFTRENEKNKMMDHFLNHIDDFPELKDCLIVADKSDRKSVTNKRVRFDKIEWSNPLYWDEKTTNRVLIYVIDQTCSRSTELKCHPRIYAMHDFRNRISYNTVAQAQLRVTHYISTHGYPCFQRIRVYGSVPTFTLAAGLIDYKEYLTYEWKKKKIDSRTSPVEKYKVMDTTGHLHPSCGEEGMDERDADRLLQEHGCFAERSISSRIDGTVREVRVYEGEWIQVSPESWDEVSGKLPNKKSPFTPLALTKKEGNRWRGQHRGWKHLEYKEGDLYERIDGELKKIDKGSTGGTRLKICYQDDVLGVFLAHCTGTKVIDTLRTSEKSMYT